MTSQIAASNDKDVLAQLHTRCPCTFEMDGDRCTSLSFHSENDPLCGVIRRHENKQEILALVARLPFLETLNLRKCKVGHVPKLATTSLRALDLSCNNLDRVPDWLTSQRALQRLNLGANNLTELPDLSGLPLTSLKLHKNKLTRLPAIGTGLACLNLYLNPLRAIPDQAFAQPELELFSYGVGQLQPLTSLACWPKLRWLTISATNLAKLPDDICELAYLEGLLLAKNKLTELPPNMDRLQRLRAITIYQNQIRELPPEFYKLKLNRLNLAGNPLDPTTANQQFQTIEFYRS